MSTLTCLCAVCLLLVAFVGSRSIPGSEQGIRDIGRLIPGSEQKIRDVMGGRTYNEKDIRDILEGLNKKTPSTDWKIPDIPAKVIVILLRAYCQYLRDQGIINLPEYCYTLPAVTYPHGEIGKSPLLSETNSRGTGINRAYY